MSDTPWKGTIGEARRVLDLPSNAVTHLIANPDGTFSIAVHVESETCVYCEPQGDCRGRPDVEPTPFIAEPEEWTDEDESDASRHPLIGHGDSEASNA